MTVLAPAISGLDSLVGICLITMIAQVFWFFGLHGASITQPIRLPFMQMYLIANLSAFSAGQPRAAPSGAGVVHGVSIIPFPTIWKAIKP